MSGGKKYREDENTFQDHRAGLCRREAPDAERGRQHCSGPEYEKIHRRAEWQKYPEKSLGESQINDECKKHAAYDADKSEHPPCLAELRVRQAHQPLALTHR